MAPADRLSDRYRPVPWFKARKIRPLLLWAIRGVGALAVLPGLGARSIGSLAGSIFAAVAIYIVLLYVFSEDAPELLSTEDTLTPLTELVGINRQTAAELERVGYTSAEELAVADINTLVARAPITRTMAERYQSSAVQTIGGRDIARRRLNETIQPR